MAALEAARTAAEGAAALQVQQAEERKRRQEVEAIFRMMDTDSDGYLDFETEVMQFYIFMKDRRGFIVQRRMRQWMDRNKLVCTDAELSELMEMMNSSNDDRGISYEDLLQFYSSHRFG